VENDAMPLATRAVPMTVVPSRNVTVPVEGTGPTVTVNVTSWPGADGLTLDVNVIAVLTAPHGFSSALTSTGIDK
jgi:hypothetical protein